MFRSLENKVISWERLSELSAGLRTTGKKIVTTNGCFDLLHWGHIHYLEEARALGDVLWVGINSDASVKMLKGPNRPICEEKSRLLQVAALECVSFVTVFPQSTPLDFLRLVHPHIHVKGGDYKGREIPEMKLMSELGGEVQYLSLVKGFSTTNILKALEKI